MRSDTLTRSGLTVLGLRFFTTAFPFSSYAVDPSGLSITFAARLGAPVPLACCTSRSTSLNLVPVELMPASLHSDLSPSRVTPSIPGLQSSCKEKRAGLDSTPKRAVPSFSRRRATSSGLVPLNRSFADLHHDLSSSLVRRSNQLSLGTFLGFFAFSGLKNP